MNLQRSLNVSLTRLHTNKPAGTCNWPLPRHRPCLYDQKQEPKECVYLHLWMLETQYLCSNARLSPCTLDIISVARMGGRTLYTMNTALLNLQADKPAPCPVSCMQTASQQSTVQPTSTSQQHPVSCQSRLAWQIVGPHVIHKWALAQHAQGRWVLKLHALLIMCYSPLYTKTVGVYSYCDIHLHIRVTGICTSCNFQLVDAYS